MSEWVNADSSSIIIEDEDWLDNVPSPGISVNQEIVDPIWGIVPSTIVKKLSLQGLI